LKQTLNINKIY